MLLEVACQDEFDEAGWAEEYADRQEVLEGVQRRSDRQEARPEEGAAGQGGGTGGARAAGLHGGGRRGVCECVRVTGKKPIQVRWVDVDKGFGVYRSRLVAKDFRPKNKIDDREGLFAATPPLEVVKFLVVQAATKCRQGVVRKVKLIDISKAHLYAPIEGEQYVDLAPERAKAGKCAKLLSTLYGLRTAASSWEREYAQTLEAEGFVPGIASKCTFFHPARMIRIVVHGDDFVIEGGQEDLDWTKGVLANHSRLRSIFVHHLELLRSTFLLSHPCKASTISLSQLQLSHESRMRDCTTSLCLLCSSLRNSLALVEFSNPSTLPWPPCSSGISWHSSSQFPL